VRLEFVFRDLQLLLLAIEHSKFLGRCFPRIKLCGEETIGV